MTERDRITWALLALRVGIFIVMFMWTLDKFVQVEHALGIYAAFYGLAAVGEGIMTAVAVVELLLILGFLAGFQKRFTYGAVLVLHAVSTLSSYRQYLDPFNNLLFFAAWPMLAACLAVYLLRELDTKWTIGGAAASAGGAVARAPRR